MTMNDEVKRKWNKSVTT